MSIREPSRHAQCGVCTRHKLIISKLGNDRAARDSQMREFVAHLQRQYRDRTHYWAARSASCLPMVPSGKRTVCFVTDAIDHAKFRFPRSRIFRSKDLSNYVRPCMDMSAVLGHGSLVHLYLSEPYVRKDSSWCCEIRSHAVHCLPFDTRGCELIVQSDNCSRETKNNSLCRWSACLVGLHTVSRLELRFLATGHSHEDVDQFFSMVASMLERSPELHPPQQFVTTLEGWLQDKSVREHDPLRSVMKVDQVRDWSHGKKSQVSFSCPPFY